MQHLQTERPGMKALRYYIPAILWIILILVLCTLPGKDVPHTGWFSIKNLDKLVHFGLFGGIVFFLALGYYRQKKNVPALMLLVFVLSAALYGLAIEFIQKYYTVDRSFDMRDAAADTLGAIAGVWAFKLFRRWFLKPRTATVQ
ncbi:VanZ family protein [uncultured Chitinophaga sp.]|uniref:VanZ family protein n=1 Tax=uncultured Chitinophaga sp. TaxID=339340 RepID=UPI00261409FF|nr:VanZ family protein [uncultured Chitinophaga sp.]